MPTTEKHPPFIADQVWQLLDETHRPELYLQTHQLRAGRPDSAAPSAAESKSAERWMDVSPSDIALNCVPGHAGTPIDVARLVITTDAGIGKTTAVDWLLYRINRPETGLLAVRLPAGDFCSESTKLMCGMEELDRKLVTYLAGQIAKPSTETTPNDRLADLQRSAVQIIERFRRQKQKLVILIDELDQAGPDVDRLKRIVESPFWSACRFVIAGRPYSIQKHWDRLFAGKPWRFVKLDEFTEEQQKTYLGQTADGSWRFAQIPLDARSILSVPRVLYYLWTLRHDDLSRFTTAAAVYEKAIDTMIKEGMARSHDARLLGCEGEKSESNVQQQNVREAWNLLSAIAYVMLFHSRHEIDPATGQQLSRPNFSRINAGADFNAFDAMLRKYYCSISKAGLGQDWKALAALNDILEHGVFDTNVEGLSEIEFRNRSLQEFLAARFLAEKAEAADAAQLWEWMYLPEFPDTEEFYYFWQFLCDMPEPACQPDAWLKAIESLFRRSFVRTDGARDAKRSSEMIFRSWPHLDRLCLEKDRRAVKIRDAWWTEFEEILGGAQETERQTAATDLTTSFLTLPGYDQFRMGSPGEHQGMPNDQREYWEEWIRVPAQQFEGHLAADLDRFRAATRQDKAILKERAEILRHAHREQSIAPIERYYWQSDETPKEWEQKIEAFSLSRKPAINAWYRLYAPRHGMRPAWYADGYSRISAEPAQPAICVSFYDAWAFAMWCRWNGNQCRLPWENEWEYAAKFGTNWDQKYWWGNNPNPDYFNGENRVGKTNVPTSDHANPKTKTAPIDPLGVGLMDMLGNVWEWCLDVYRVEYQRLDVDAVGHPGSFRVDRGGCWVNRARSCRSAFRSRRSPDYRSGHLGFRLALSPSSGGAGGET